MNSELCPHGCGSKLDLDRSARRAGVMERGTPRVEEHKDGKADHWTPEIRREVRS